MTTRTMKLDPIKVPIDDLLLDPNNPRFVQDLRIEANVPDHSLDAQQAKLLKRFTLAEEESVPQGTDDETPFFSIKDLTDSMKRIGFVPIDRVVVRKLGDSQKYVVIEGNRRISAAKRLLESDKKDGGSAEQQLSDDIRESLSAIDVLLLESSGLSEDELHNDIGVVLGLRHYGQVLGWDPLPRAVNIYKEYMALRETPDEPFRLNPGRITDVAARLSISRSDVKNALRTYVAFRQLTDEFNPPPKPTHYSLIAALVSSTKLTTHYFSQDPSTFELSTDSLERLYRIGQFDTRDVSQNSILTDPKDATPLGKLVSEAFGSPDLPTRDFARSLLAEVESGERPLDDAIDNLKSFSASRRWVDSLKQLLEKRAESLKIEDFKPVGNDLMNFEEASKAFRNVRKILEV